MKQYLLAGLLAVGMIGSGWAQNLQKVDADFGFRTMKLGLPTNAHPELVYAGLGGDNDPSLRYYERPGETLAFANVPLRAVRYAYYKGKLGSILLTVDKKYSGALWQALVARYGKAEQYPGIYEWKGKRATVVLAESDGEFSSVLIASSEFEKMTKERMRKQGMK